jgi:O-Antigen ligase
MHVKYAVTPILSQAKWVALGAFAVYCFFRGLGNLRMPKSGASLFFLALPLIGSISTLLQLRSADEGLRWILGFFVLYAIGLIFPVPRDPIIRLVLWSRAFMLACGVIVWISLATLTDSSRYHGGRFWGIMDHPNFLASCASVLSISMAGTLIFGTRKQRPVALINLAAGLFCLVSTGARSALYATVFSLAVVSIRVLSRKNAIAVSVALGALAGPVIFARDIINLFSPSQVIARSFDISNRTDIWAYQTEAFLRSPLMGGGFEMHDRTGIGRSGGEGSYMDLLSAVGILGAIPYFAGIVLAVTRYNRFLARLRSNPFVDPTQRLYLTNGFGLMISILVLCISEEWLGLVGTPISIFVWVLFPAAADLRVPRRMPAWRPFPERPAPSVSLAGRRA